MKRWKKLLIPLGITVVLIGGGLAMINPFTGEDEPKYKHEQDRVAQYLVEHYELTNGDAIKTIKVIEFDKNDMTGTWRITITVNEKYDISFNENELGGEIRSSNYSPKEFIVQEKINHIQSNSDIELTYYHGE
ncbi:hypothetical protein ACVR0S_06300 [Streptococcus dentapri]|uniref:Uncharacterized protein n=1 Tax=Streptococcus dentapri TaxID=573564 RepID=A0ABV8CZE6_9STRE